MADVFRFVVQRPVQRAAPQNIKRMLIAIYPPDAPLTELHSQLAQTRAQGDRNGMADIARAFIASPRFVSAIAALGTPIAKLDAWLLDRSDKASAVEISDQVKALTGKRPSELVATPAYRDDRLRTADSLIAMNVEVSGRERLRSELVRALYVFGLVERVAEGTLLAAATAASTAAAREPSLPQKDGSDGDRQREKDAVYRLLTRGIAALPSDVFPLPPKPEPVPAPNTSPAITGGATLDGNAAGGAEPALRLQAVLAATKELRATLDEQIALATLPEKSGSPSVSDKAPAASAPGTVAPLNPPTNTTIADRAPFANLPDMINRLESQAAILGGTLARDNHSTRMVALGGTLMDASALRSLSPNGHATRLPADALVRTPGVAELKVVRQKLKRYEMGEIAYIENVLRGEAKERVHRHKASTETTLVIETERVQESEQDLQSTQRFELQREATQTAHEDSQLQTGLTVTASYGPTVSATGTLGYASGTSRDQAARQASSYAREVTERSVTRIQERVRTQRTIISTSETEETNKHVINNSAGTGHSVGIYRWVDKIYEAQVFNYGRRLLLEFNVPEPAAFFLHTLATQAPGGITLEKPEAPTVVDADGKSRDLSPVDIRPETYLAWVQTYQVAGVAPPPQPFERASLVWDEADSGDHDHNKVLFKATKEMEIPVGYRAIWAEATVYASAWKGDTYLTVGTARMRGSTVPGEPGGAAIPAVMTAKMSLEQGRVPIALHIQDVWGFSLALEVLCERTEDAMTKWQLVTYEQIMRAYLELKAQYDEQVAAASARAGVFLPSDGTDKNRSIEQTELKKAVVTMLTGGRLLQNSAIVEGPPPGKYPEIDIAEAQREARAIAFFEQAFEWPQMTYTLYPYFWGRKDRWTTASVLDAADPLFAGFLQAGAARVVVPVRLGFEMTVGYYLATDEIWDGGQVPQVGDDLYVSIAQEIQEQQDAPPAGVAEGDPWEVRLPTTLAILQQDATLPAQP